MIKVLKISVITGDGSDLLLLIKVLKISVITGDGSDLLLLKTELPPSEYPWETSPILSLRVSKDAGVEYVKKNFPGVEVEVIKA